MASDESFPICRPSNKPGRRTSLNVPRLNQRKALLQLKSANITTTFKKNLEELLKALIGNMDNDDSNIKSPFTLKGSSTVPLSRP